MLETNVQQKDYFETETKDVFLLFLITRQNSLKYIILQHLLAQKNVILSLHDKYVKMTFSLQDTFLKQTKSIYYEWEPFPV